MKDAGEEAGDEAAAALDGGTRTPGPPASAVVGTETLEEAGEDAAATLDGGTRTAPATSASAVAGALRKEDPWRVGGGDLFGASESGQRLGAAVADRGDGGTGVLVRGAGGCHGCADQGDAGGQSGACCCSGDPPGRTGRSHVAFRFVRRGWSAAAFPVAIDLHERLLGESSAPPAQRACGLWEVPRLVVLQMADALRYIPR